MAFNWMVELIIRDETGKELLRHRTQNSQVSIIRRVAGEALDLINVEADEMIIVAVNPQSIKHKETNDGS